LIYSLDVVAAVVRGLDGVGDFDDAARLSIESNRPVCVAVHLMTCIVLQRSDDAGKDRCG
jgi:hypothetical protein